MLQVSCPARTAAFRSAPACAVDSNSPRDSCAVAGAAHSAASQPSTPLTCGCVRACPGCCWRRADDVLRLGRDSRTPYERRDDRRVEQEPGAGYTVDWVLVACVPWGTRRGTEAALHARTVRWASGWSRPHSRRQQQCGTARLRAFDGSEVGRSVCMYRCAVRGLRGLTLAVCRGRG